MRVLLLEDDAILGEALRDFLRSEGHVVDWLHNLAGARAVEREPFDLLLVDWNLPDGLGVSWLAALRANGRSTPAIILTARDRLADRIEGLDSGADDYLVKPFAPEELSARIRALTRRLNGEASRQLCFGDVRIDLTRHEAHSAGALVTLTAREWAVLEALALRAGRIVSKADLDALVNGFDGESSSNNTLEVHVSRLRRKLSPALIETVRGLGYRIPA
ncbi:response regulator transcription factor [Zoogloea sp. LCSB751]|uniref:response regulator transcription factor n=1 Tax=Zoogloea sp. LCSB751 TaxID=1965277 RepID=UPI0009A4C2F8|nr:response regulator transcription factor [Zoogloea sp. LCSB751]